MILIRELRENEIDAVKYFPPEDWHFDIVTFLKYNFHKKYFTVLVAELNNEIVGVGNVFILEKTAWLGNIIVLNDYRNKGIGTRITEELINNAKENNCEYILLIATQLGEKVYSKLGFKVSSYYEFYKAGEITDYNISSNIIKSTPAHYPEIEKLDLIISGEFRSGFISNYYSNSFVFYNFVDKKIDGFYLSEYGNGLIIAENNIAGIELLKLRSKEKRFNTVTPEQNLNAKNFLLNNGFVMYNKAPRMYLGKDVNWKPELIFSRGTGYTG